MKKLVLALLTLCLMCFIAGAEEESLQSRYEENTVFTTLKVLCQVGSDQIGTWDSAYAVRSGSEALKAITSFDNGWFGAVGRTDYLDFRSENWVALSDTAFECDAYGVCRITYKYGYYEVDFPLAYHMCFELADAANDYWKLTDYHNLPIEENIAKAERISLENEGITLKAVNGPHSYGYMLVIDDPSRVFAGTIDSFSEASAGMRIDELARKHDALAAINGGCFSDPGENGNGGQAVGLVVSKGVRMCNHMPNASGCNVVIGLDEQDKLVVGQFSYEEVDQIGCRDALAFHTELVQNGEAVPINERSTYTTRTAIGQDADGKILMLVMAGRQPGALGAKYEDLQQIMLSFGAVTAGNLDGGTSGCMYIAGESIFSGNYKQTSRALPTSFMVSK